MSIRKVGRVRGSTDRRHTRRPARGVGIELGALALVVAFVLAACSGSGDTAPVGDATAPANEPTEGTPDAEAVEVATAFLKAYGASDVDQAATYLSDDANLSDLPNGTLDNPEADWFRAMGYEQILGTCEVTASSESGTSVHCPYDFHVLRSEEVGNGPYSGSFFELTVKDGAIVRASEHFEFEDNGFSAEMWEPFAKWVKKTHPKEILVMYVDETQTMGRLDKKSLRLWEELSLEYANEVAAS